MKFKLGQKVKDTITDFEGIVMGYHKWITGCDQYTILPKSEGGKASEGATFDEGRLVKVGVGVSPKEVQTKKAKGCDMVAPRK
jgi:hypothetical protein